MSLKLFTFWRSSASYRVRIALNLKQLDYKTEPIHFRKEGGQHRKPGFLARNPQGLLPVLQEDGWYLNQSLAIVEYLDEIHPEPPLLPQNPRARAEIRAMSQMITCEIHPLNNLRVLAYLGEQLGQQEESIHEWYTHWITLGFEALETRLNEVSDKYCYGNKISLVDTCLVPQVYNARRFDVDLTPYQKIIRIDRSLNELDAFADAAPEKQTDAG